MTKHILTVIIVLLVGWKIYLANSGSSNERFPNQPIQIVVPYQAGGGSDTFARIFQKSLAKNETLNVPMVIVNRPGGSATIGSRVIKDARPDGYRLLCHHEGIIATKLAGTVPYGAEAFEPVAQAGAKILLMIARADSKYESLIDLLEAAQNESNEIRIGANEGSPAWFICKQMLAEYPGAEFNFVPADGSKRLSYILGNKLEAGIFSVDEFMANRNSEAAPPSENIKAIANFSLDRHPAIPEVATSTEQGLKTNAENAFYFWAPKNTPDEVVNVLADAFETAMSDPDVLAELKRLSIPPTFRRGAELDEHLASRVNAFDGIAIQADAKLPNFPAWVIGIVSLLGILVLAQTFQSGGHVADRELNGSADSLSPTKMNSVGFVCITLLCGYVLLLQLGVPFVISTTVSIFLVGATISSWDKKWLFSIGQLGLLFSLGLELVFTQLFTVPLP